MVECTWTRGGEEVVTGGEEGKGLEVGRAANLTRWAM